MLELNDTNPAVDVQESEYVRLLGFPRGHVLADRSRELADWARRWYGEFGRPWLYGRETEGLAVAGGLVTLDGTTFRSPGLHDRMSAARAESAVVVAVSAGPQCEAEARRLWEDGRPDEFFFLEIFGSAVVESLVAAASYRLCAWADEHGLAVLPHYSPGYPQWDVSDQQTLLALIQGGGRLGRVAEIRALETGMLVPKKSLLAVFGLAREVASARRLATLVPCETCALPRCRYRRAPQRRSLPSLEAVRPSAPVAGAASDARRAALTPGARYSFGREVLRQWSRERLRVRVSGDGTLDAHFRYDGTTCSDLGRPLAFDHHVRLSSPEDGYRITELACEPVPGDAGHTSMCRYLEEPAALMGSIAGERPLLGRPLDEVLGWQRTRSPAGCYCTAESRAHRWGLVLEVLRFALSQDDLAPEAPRAGPGPDPGTMDGRAEATDRLEAP
jgi:hypothetical protein